MIKTVCMAFAYGSPPSLPINKNLALRAATVCKSRSGIPLYTQNEVALAGVMETDFLRHDVEMYVLGEDQPYVSTLWLARKLKGTLQEQGYDIKTIQVVVVAAPMHWPRCLRDLKKVGFTMVQENSQIYHGLVNYFDRRSTQFWTRYKFLCHLRETILLNLPWKWYEKITLSENIAGKL